MLRSDIILKVLVDMANKHGTLHVIHWKKKPLLLSLQARFLADKVTILEVPKLPTVKAIKKQAKVFNEKVSQSIQENIDPELLAMDLGKD